MAPIFISHATADDAFVMQLRRALEGHGLSVWADSRNLRGGDHLKPEIEAAIDAARAVIAVLGPQTFNSKWVRDEIRRAAVVEQQRADFRLIPLLLPGVEPSALWIYFDEDKEPLAVRVDPARLDEALPALLAALGEQLPEDAAPAPEPPAAPVDDLILELRDPRLVELNGAQRAQATATLIYQPADSAARQVESKRYTVTAPLGPIELEDIRWYLEEFALWPVGVFAQRARRAEAQLPAWGRALFEAALGAPAARAALTAWQGSPAGHARRFSVQVDPDAPDGADAAAQTAVHRAATELLALPWELLGDEGGYLLHGANPVSLRRRLPNRQPRPVAPAEPPIRILLLSPRPELAEDGQTPVGYIDHRASALPLVSAVENLGSLAALTVLHPPTLPALEQALQQANQAGDPFDVVHFDGHGVYDRRQGLGALLFEAPQDADKPGPRRSRLVHADRLAAIMRDYGIPLVFLEACQSSLTEDDLNSVATRLLQEGVSSVAAMSYSVLVETARRYVEAFYGALAAGGRVGAAHLAGQQALAGDSFRGKVMGAGELHLRDWFVPVLYQDAADPRLFSRLLPGRVRDLQKERRKLALGALPETPPHTFIGRSRELLYLERLLAQERYAVVRGTGGAGKTTLAVELARWLARSGRFGRAAFVSLENVADARAVLDSLGHQLLPDGDKYSVAHYPTLAAALQPVARALRDDATLIVLDHVESALPAPGADVGAGFKPAPTAELFDLCRALLDADGRARIVFTSREALPAPFDGGRQRVELGALSERDAVALVERVMANAGWQPAPTDPGATPQEVLELVNAVNRHARALVLLARDVARLGVRATTANLTAIMAAQDAAHPGDRENSLYASLELSLQRLTTEMREQVKALAVFQGGAQLSILAMVMEVDVEVARALAIRLIDVGLAEEMPYAHLRVDPALGAYLRRGLDAAALAALTERWAAAMRQLVDFLSQQLFQDAQMARQLTLLELPNLLALLEWLPDRAAPEDVVAVAGRIEQLLAELGRPAALARAAAAREEASGKLGEWGHARFEHERLALERRLGQGDGRGALAAAEALRQRALAAGEAAYPGAAYDIGVAHILLGRVLRTGGQAGAALEPLGEAQRRFEALAAQGDKDAAGMASAALTEQADCLTALGRLDDAAALYERAIALDEARGDARDVAVGRTQLGTVRQYQRRYAEALAAYAAARDVFERLGEPAGVATLWHQIGRVHRQAGQFEAAERAYRQSLAIEVQQGNAAGQASSLGELGNLYAGAGRLEEAVTFYRQAADIAVRLGDQAKEGLRRSNIAGTLVKLGRLDEARREIERAIECARPFGHAAEPWKTFAILHNIEAAGGNAAAAGAAWRQARDAYLAYRRDGGYARGGAGEVADQLLTHLRRNDHAAARALVAGGKQAGWPPLFVAGLEAILAGSRALPQADDPALHYQLATELLLLLERLAAGH